MDWLGVDWIRMTKELGFPTVVALVAILFILLAARWLAENLVKPLVAGHSKFLDSTITTQERTQACLDGLREQGTALVQQMTKQTEILGHVVKGP